MLTKFSNVVGFSAVIFIPLIFLALYVNKLITNVKQLYKQAIKTILEPESLLESQEPDYTDNHDSDDEKTYVDKRTFHARSETNSYGAPSNKPVGSDDENTSSCESDDEDGTGKYAPMFGHYHFHRRIPVLRNLWKYRHYRQPHSRRHDNRWKDTYIESYPIQYYQQKMNFWVLMLLVTILAYFGSVKHQRVSERYKKGKRLAMDDCETSSEDSEGSSSSHVQRKKRSKRKYFGGGRMKKSQREKSLGLDSRRPGVRSNASEGDEEWSLRRHWSTEGDSGRMAVSNASLQAPEAAIDRQELRIVPQKVGRGGALGWLGIRKGRAKGTIDEERELGDPEGALKWRGAKGPGLELHEASPI